MGEFDDFDVRGRTQGVFSDQESYLNGEPNTQAVKPNPVLARTDRQPQVHYCPHCNSSMPLDSNDRYCTNCGSPNPYYKDEKSTGKKFLPLMFVALGMVAALGMGAIMWKVLLQRPMEDRPVAAELADEDSSDTNGESTADATSEEVTNAEKAANFPREWSGSFDGYSQYVEGGVLTSYMRLHLLKVNEDGSFEGTCNIETYDETNGKRQGSYLIEGTIDWDSANVDMYGTKWIDDTDFVHMRRFRGMLTADQKSMSGTTVTLSGEHEGKWEATAAS